MKKVISIENKIISIFYGESTLENSIPVIVLNTFNEDGQEVWDKAKEFTNKDFILVTISNIEWNSEMSPWYMNKQFKDDDNYSGQADEYIKLLSNKIIPKVNNIINLELNKKVDYYAIAGYSLAGLFAVYSLYKTSIFSSAISCSGSLWYPKFDAFIKSNNLKTIPNKIYFSLGRKEKYTKNVLMSNVEEKTKDIELFFESKNIQTIYEENEGNHFQNVIERIAKGISWILK